MNIWRPISNGGKFYVQFSRDYIMHEDSRGRYVRYKSIENAQKAANKLNRQMRHDAYTLIREAHENRRAIDHINGDITDNRLCNLRVITLRGNL